MYCTMNILKLILITFTIKQLQSQYTRREKKLYDPKSSSKLFSKYLKKFDKNYCGVEYKRRLRYFTQNLKFVNKLNQANSSAVFGLTPFSDKSRKEIKKLTKKHIMQYLKKAPKHKVHYANNFTRTKLSDENIPERWDWQDHGAVTTPANQGGCGCCWAFTAAGAVEGRYAVKNRGQMRPVSVQQLLDCCTDEHTCAGGFQEEALRIITDFGGLVSRDDYPYREARGECLQWDKKIVVETDGADVVYVPSEEHLKHLVYRHGPIAAGMVTGDPFFHYKGGLVTGADLQCHDGKSLSHAVLITGYGGAPGKEYWIIKNSFGQGWGERGFFFLARNIDPSKSQCAITEYLVQAHVL